MNKNLIDFNCSELYENQLTEKFIEEHIDEVDWRYISIYQILSNSFIEKHSDKLNLYLIYQFQILSEDFIEKHIDIINWYFISQFQKLSEGFIEKYKNKFDLHLISQYQKLNEEFIERNSDRINWYWISMYQKLSLEFIERHSNEVDWLYISKYQKLNSEFIEKHIDKLNLSYISKYQKLSSEFIEKYGLKIPKNSWMYKDIEYKRYKILNTKLYELEEDYIIAYKAVRKDNYSVYNFQYQYEIGKEYTAHADYNPENKDSFGLSVWTYESAKKYFNKGKILKVKIHLNDVAVLEHDGHKLRCTKIIIIDEVK
jgi:hypothetical protein